MHKADVEPDDFEYAKKSGSKVETCCLQISAYKTTLFLEKLQHYSQREADTSWVREAMFLLQGV